MLFDTRHLDMAARQSALVPANDAGRSPNELPELVSGKTSIVPRFANESDSLTKVKPESLISVYTGESDPTRWLRDVGDIAEDFSWTEKFTCRIMMTKMKGLAKNYIETAIPTGETLTFGKIATLLELRFKARESLLVKLMKFRAVTQEKGEGLAQFAARVRALGFETCTSDAETAALDPKLLVAFTAGLRDNQLRQAVMLAKPQTFSETVDLAITTQAEFGRTDPVMSQVNVVTRSATAGERKAKVHRPTDRESRPSASGWTNEARQRKMKCNVCKKPNHVAEDCRIRLFKEGLCFVCKSPDHQRDFHQRHSNNDSTDQPSKNGRGGVLLM